FCEVRSRQIYPKRFHRIVEKHKIPYHEKTLGQLFCDHAASDITQMLESECRGAGVQIFLNQAIREVSKGAEFVIRTNVEEFHASTLVVASGGLSIPKIGSTPFGYEVAKQFGMKIQEPRPALVPLTFSEKDKRSYSDLTGVSMEVIA